MSKRRSLAQPASVPAPSDPTLPAEPTPIDPNSPSDPERHSRKCQICHHPDRDFIEDEFIHWIRPDYIVVKYDLHDRSYLYRHARALGLDMQRRRNLRQALEPILEQNQCVRVNAQSVLSAARI